MLLSNLMLLLVVVTRSGIRIGQLMVMVLRLGGASEAVELGLATHRCIWIVNRYHFRRLQNKAFTGPSIAATGPFPKTAAGKKHRSFDKYRS